MADSAKYFRVPQAYPFTVRVIKPEGADLSTKTVLWFMIASDGTTYRVGQGTGGAERTSFEVQCTPHFVPVEHTYMLEGVAAITSQNPITVCPNKNTASRVYIHLFNMYSF